jgi:anti-anti-sigma factor
MAEFLRVQTIQSAHVVELSLPELLDPLEFDRLNEQMLAALDGKAAEKWIVDLTTVHYMGSAMLGMMVNIRQRVKSAGGKLVLCGLSSRLLNIFRACSMERLFTIARTRPDALRLTSR